MTDTYEALGFDPAPGVPASVERLVNSLSKVGNQLHHAHSTLTRLGKRDGIWEGEAAANFSKKIGQLPKYLDEGHTSLIDAAQVLHKWESKLSDFQSLARMLEDQAEAARRRLREAEHDPDFDLDGRSFPTQAEADGAQARLDAAISRAKEAKGDLESIIKRAEDLLGDHDDAARQAAAAIRRAADPAPDEPGLLDKLMGTLADIESKIADAAKDLWKWLHENADLLYSIGDWLGWASALCDVLAVMTSETVVGAAIFEAIGMTLNVGALAFHAGGWAFGSKKGNWLDIGLDVAGFIPFGDFGRGFKVVGALKNKEITIPSNILQSGSKAADAFKRADDIIDAVGGTARRGKTDVEEVRKGFGKVEREVVSVTAENFTDRLKVAMARHFGDESLYSAGGLTDKIMPKIIENTPLKNIPHIADSVKPIVDDTGEMVGKYIDPRSWAARGVEAAKGTVGLVSHGVRYITHGVEYRSERIHDKLDKFRDPGGIDDFG